MSFNMGCSPPFFLYHRILSLYKIQQVCSRRLWTYFFQNIENLHNWMDNLWQKVENNVAKRESARFVQFLLCFVTMFSKKPSAAEVSKSVYMRERVNIGCSPLFIPHNIVHLPNTTSLHQTTLKSSRQNKGNISKTNSFIVE